MKKIISLMLVILMLASSMLMISCFNDDDDDDDDSTKINAKSEIKSAIEKMETVDSYTGTSSLAIDVKSQGITVTLEMNYAIKMADLLTDPKRYADVSITSFGVAETGVIYTEGEWDYVVAGNEKYKARVEEDNDASFSELADSIYTNAKTETVSGETHIKLSFTNEQFFEYFPSTLDAVLILFEFEDMKDYMTISDASIKFVLDKNGYVTKQEMDFNVIVSYEGEVVELKVSNVSTYGEFNKPVTITPPEGYQNFMERTGGDRL